MRRPWQWIVFPTNGRLIAEAETADLPPEARAPLELLAGQFADTKARIDAITAGIRSAAEADATARRLQI